MLVKYFLRCLLPINWSEWQLCFQTGCIMMTSSNGNIFRVTGLLCGEFTGPGEFPSHKGQWRGALMFSLICARTNRWVNNREAGELRRHQAHYDVSVMMSVDETIIASDNDSFSTCYQAFIWNNDGLLSIKSFETNYNAIWIKIQRTIFFQWN